MPLPLAALPSAKAYILAALLACAPPAAPNVRIDFEEGPVQIDNTRSKEELAALSLAHEGSSFHDAEFPLVSGLTSFSLQGRPHMMMQVAPQTGGACVSVRNIALTLSYAPIVYIAKNYAPSSCRYAQVQEHEMKHANINLITLREFVPQIKPLLANALGQVDAAVAVEGDDTTPGKEALNKKVSDVMQKWLESMLQVRVPRQQQVDSPEESRRFMKACPNEATQ
jgi:hypothetical protein